MGRRLYVGNLPYKATDEDLMSLFSRAGAVDNVRVMRDQATGRARGFAFVEMVNDEDAQKAIQEFHQYRVPTGERSWSTRRDPRNRAASGAEGAAAVAATVVAGWRRTQGAPLVEFNVTRSKFNMVVPWPLRTTRRPRHLAFQGTTRA